MALPFGVDISKWQASQDGTKRVDFDTMMSGSNPPTFIAIRSGQRADYRDPQFIYNWTAARLKALPRIAYHVLEFHIDGAVQAQYMFDLVLKAGFDPTRDRLCLDLELAGNFGNSQITSVTNKAIEKLVKLTARFPLIYSRANWIDEHLIVSQLPKLDYWLAQYLKARIWPFYTAEFPSDKITIPRGIERSQIKFHQTSDKGNGSQYGSQSHYIDYDHFLGTREQELDWFGLGEEKPEPEPPIVVDPVNPLYSVRVTDWATPHVNVRSEPRIAPATDIGDVYPNDTLQVLEEREVDGVPWPRTNKGWLMAKYTERQTQAVQGLLSVPFYSQNDPRWRNLWLNHGPTTLGQEGCLVTITAAGMTFFGHSETPQTLNDKLTHGGGYANGNQFYWNMPAVLYGNILKTDDISFPGGVGFEGDVLRILSEKRPVWAMVDYIPGGSFNQHWVLILGKVDGVFYLLDPWDGSTQALHAKYKKVFRIVGYTKS